MAFDLAGPGNQLITLADAVTGVGSQQLGVLEFPKQRLSVHVTLGGVSISGYTTGQVIIQTRFWVLFAYRVDGAIGAAETSVMVAVKDFILRLLADRKLSNTCEDIEIGTAAADEPEYVKYLGKEFREYPVVVTVTQYDSFSIP